MSSAVGGTADSAVELDLKDLYLDFDREGQTIDIWADAGGVSPESWQAMTHLLWSLGVTDLPPGETVGSGDGAMDHWSVSF